MVSVARFPVARRSDAVNQRPIVQHGEIEATTVPRDELRRVFLDAIKETLDDLAFAISRRAEGPNTQARALAQQAGNRNDALQMKRQKLVAGRRSAPLERDFRDVGIRERRIELEHGAIARDIGDSLDIKNKRRLH